MYYYYYFPFNLFVVCIDALEILFIIIQPWKNGKSDEMMEDLCVLYLICSSAVH